MLRKTGFHFSSSRSKREWRSGLHVRARRIRARRKRCRDHKFLSGKSIAKADAGGKAMSRRQFPAPEKTRQTGPDFAGAIARVAPEPRHDPPPPHRADRAFLPIPSGQPRTADVSPRHLTGSTLQPGAQIAQLVEQRIENPRVGGSIPSLGTNFAYFINLNH